jgi:hypothetical protein
MKAIRVKDLKDQIGMNGPRPVLHCAKCGETYSANAGDYFNVRPDHVFKCCGRNMALVIERHTFKAVQP